MPQVAFNTPRPLLSRHSIAACRCRTDRQQAHLDFLGVDAESPRRTREGVYASHIIQGPRGASAKLLLLDVRTHRDPWPSRPNGVAAEDGDILGETQWRWLEEELNSTADVHMIMSGFQVESNAALGLVVPSSFGESWQKFPNARRRLMDMVSSTYHMYALKKTNYILV